MKEEGNMLGLSPGLREPGHPFPGLLPGFPRGLPVLPHANGGGMSLPLPGPGPASPAMPNMWPFIWSHISNLLPQLSIARLDPLSQVFSLRWTQHQANMFSVFERLLHSEAFTDVTLACDGGSLKCHKIVLAASSDYFQKLFIDNSSEHPIVFLKDVKASQVQALLDYMYRGEVSVSQDDLPALLRVAEMLRIKGMTEENTKAQAALPIGARKDSQASGASQPLRCSSPGPGSSPLAPPNSVVPNNGDSASIPASSSIVMPPASKTPTSIPPPHGAIPPNFRPFLTPPGASSSSPFPMWPLPGLFPGAHNLFGHRHDERKELSPGARDRSKMSSGSSSDKDMQLPPLIPRDNAEDKETGSNSSFDKDSEQYNEKMKLEGIAGYVPAQRLEWKRYKQYTRNDIMAAIEEVKKGKSALQVSKKYNIPSRTLYDKVKKMGITTGRQQQRKSMNTGNQGSNFSYSAAFPGLPGLPGLPQMPHLTSDPGMGENPYKSLLDRMKVERGIKDNHEEEGEDKSVESGPRKDLGPMPFSILPPHMLNMMEKFRGEEKEKLVEESDRQEREAEAESSPMNLSSERDPEKRMSEGSFPHSPSPGSTDPTTSPSNCQNSPQGGSGSDYNGGGRDREDRDRSPDNSAQIDIRAQFLADLRRLGDRRGMTSPELAPSRQDNLPPRKRKVSHEHEAGETGNGTVGTGSKISLTIASDSAVVN